MWPLRPKNNWTLRYKTKPLEIKDLKYYLRLETQSEYWDIKKVICYRSSNFAIAKVVALNLFA